MKKTFCFDIDGTLCESVESNYPESVPIEDRIRLVNSLKAAGHKIVLFTARGASSGNDWSQLTTTQMREWEVNFDQLIMGKPHADLYIDDKAILADDFFRPEFDPERTLDSKRGEG